MKGYIITPLLFVVLFLIAASFGIYAHQADEKMGKAIAHEGVIKKAIISTQKELSAMGTVAFETIYSNPSVNEKSVMEEKIHDAIKSEYGANVAVTLSKKSGGTGVKIHFTDYVKRFPAANITLTGEDYDVVVGHPVYQFYEIYSSYNPQEICSYYHDNTTACWIDWTTYKEDKEKKTGLDFWGHDVTVDNCNSKKFSFKISITEPGNVATYDLGKNDYSLKLKNHKTGSYTFTADC